MLVGILVQAGCFQAARTGGGHVKGYTCLQVDAAKLPCLPSHRTKREKNSSLGASLNCLEFSAALELSQGTCCTGKLDLVFSFVA